MPVGLTVEEIYTQFAAGLKGFVLKRVSDPEAADDIVQNVFVNIHHHVDTLRDESRLQSWVYQIARNALIDYYRSRRPSVELDEAAAVPAEADEMAEDDPTGELAGSLQGLVACLPEPYRQALTMAEFEGLSQQQIAGRLDLSLSGAKSRVQRARDKLKEILLRCCHFEFDRAGRIVSYESRCGCCASRQAAGQQSCGQDCSSPQGCC